jgi:hypothetical protein
MKINLLKLLFVNAILAVCFAGCNQKPSGFSLKGKIQGITDGKAILSNTKGETQVSDTTLIKNGEFIFTGNIPEPGQYILSIEGKEFPKYFYAENAEMTITGKADTLYRAVVTGGTINEDQKRYQEGLTPALDKIRKEYGYDTLVTKYINTEDAELKENLKKEMDVIIPKLRAVYDQYQTDFIKQNPASFYSAILIDQMSSGMSAVEIEAKLKLLDPKLEGSSVVQDIRMTIENLKTTDLNVSDFTSDALDVAYAVDKTFAGSGHKDMVYLAAMPDDNICTLNKNGTVCILEPKGNKVSEFKSTLKSTPSAMAIDQVTGSIYVLGTIIETREVMSRGKAYKVDDAKGVECIVYNVKGTELKKIELSDLKSATGAKVINNKLLVADYNARKVFIYDLVSGQMESSINDLRACCRILDFGVNGKNEILVANLGAFRVQAFDYSGKIKYAFGKRGQTLNDFHGCCNPVNVTSLTSGAIVTVEKDPTRIKVYSKSGAAQIAGIQELVRGCRYIPMTSDSKNNLYLASAMSGIIKCTPQ